MIELFSTHPNAWVHWALLLITIYIIRSLLNMFRLPADSEFVRDRVVLITGGGSGIGRKMALQFARRNAIVVIWDIFEAGMQETVKLVQSAGGRIHSYKVDITDIEQVNVATHRVNSEVGAIYALINNAGVVFGQRIMDASPAHIRRTFDVNLLSNFWTVKAILPGMKAHGGHIVTVSSVCGFAGFHSLSDYCASKWGSFAFAESLRQEIQSDPECAKIHSSVICPYFIQTGMFAGINTEWLANLIAGPPLDEDIVALRIVQAVRYRDDVVIMPDRLWIMLVLRCLPVSFLDFAQRLIGVRESMAKFRGRGHEFSLGKH